MDIFLQKRIASLQKVFINPLEPSGLLFMMNACSFLGFKSTIHSH